MVNNWIRRLLPARCLLCGMDAGMNSGREGFCAGCVAELPHIAHPCPLCALPLPAADILACGACLSEPPPYARCVSAIVYAAPADRLIAGLKYRRQLPVARVLAQCLLDQIGAEPGIDAILPVPLHWRRRWLRGFNQAEVIADELSRALGVPHRSRWLRRRRPTPPQQALSAAERRRNLRGAFVVTAPVAGLRIALVDDVITTGSTVEEIARLLRKAGASSIEVWCLARTPR